MKKASVLRYAAIGMATLSLAGFAAASSVSMTETGPDSYNKVHLNNGASATVVNTNAVGVASFNAQGASTGDVSAYKNTSVDGDNGSGNAQNTNSTGTGVTVSNTGSSVAALGALAGGAGMGNDDVDFLGTGPDSTNKVEINNEREVNVVNTNLIQVSNTNVQGASSGNVSATKNTTVGGLSSGNASNSNTTTTSVNVSN
jgi:hypothetical protein